MGAACNTAHMQNPENLRVTAVAEDLAVRVYGFIKTLPDEERNNLVSQMRRSASSIVHNIHEACGKEGNRAMLPFLHHAMGSASELDGQFRFTQRVEIGDQRMAQKLWNKTVHLKIMLSKLIKSIQTRLDDEP